VLRGTEIAADEIGNRNGSVLFYHVLQFESRAMGHRLREAAKQSQNSAERFALRAERKAQDRENWSTQLGFEVLWAQAGVCAKKPHFATKSLAGEGGICSAVDL